MITVIIEYPNYQRKEVLLSGVPRVGEHIRLKDCPVSGPPLIVDYVLWTEDVRDPEVVVGVHKLDKQIRG